MSQKKLEETEEDFLDAQEKIRAAYYSIKEREYVINKLQESGFCHIYLYTFTSWVGGCLYFANVLR